MAGLSLDSETVLYNWVTCQGDSVPFLHCITHDSFATRTHSGSPLRSALPWEEIAVI